MKKLIHVVRGQPDVGMSFGLGRDAGNRHHPEAILTHEVDAERHDLKKRAEFFLVNPEDCEIVVRHLAEANPGHEVRVYTIESIAQCPAGPMVSKKITESGVLPQF